MVLDPEKLTYGWTSFRGAGHTDTKEKKELIQNSITYETHLQSRDRLRFDSERLLQGHSSVDNYGTPYQGLVALLKLIS